MLNLGQQQLLRTFVCAPQGAKLSNDVNQIERENSRSRGDLLKVFWSWQSDTPGSTGRHFIKAALQAAISELKSVEEIEEAVRLDLHLDSDRQGVAGSPDLARLILEKIDTSFVIVADVTAVGAITTAAEKATKKLINSNVAIELGYALKALGTQGTLMVMNDFYGGRTDLPFDLQAKAGPILFSLPPDATQEIKSKQKALLKSQLRDALRLCLDEQIKAVAAAREVDREVDVPRISSIDWERLGQRIGQGCKFLRADTQREKDWPTERWSVTGGSSQVCESLLRKAGAMLLKSANVKETVPDFIAQEPDDLVRWLAYLKYRGHHQSTNYYQYQNDDGTTRFGGVLGSIPHLCQSSSVVCEECSAVEL